MTKVQRFCDGWTKKPHAGADTKRVVHPLGNESQMCDCCIDDLIADYTRGNGMGMCRVYHDDSSFDVISPATHCRSHPLYRGN